MKCLNKLAGAQTFMRLCRVRFSTSDSDSSTAEVTFSTTDSEQLLQLSGGSRNWGRWESVKTLSHDLYLSVTV